MTCAFYCCVIPDNTGVDMTFCVQLGKWVGVLILLLHCAVFQWLESSLPLLPLQVSGTIIEMSAACIACVLKYLSILVTLEHVCMCACMCVCACACACVCVCMCERYGH